jgi:hypothetical protein
MGVIQTVSRKIRHTFGGSVTLECNDPQGESSQSREVDDVKHWVDKGEVHGDGKCSRHICDVSPLLENEILQGSGDPTASAPP